MTDHVEMILAAAKYGGAVSAVQIMIAMMLGGWIAEGEGKKTMGICAAWSAIFAIVFIAIFFLVLIADAVNAL